MPVILYLPISSFASGLGPGLVGLGRVVANHSNSHPLGLGLVGPGPVGLGLMVANHSKSPFGSGSGSGGSGSGSGGSSSGGSGSQPQQQSPFGSGSGGSSSGGLRQPASATIIVWVC